MNMLTRIKVTFVWLLAFGSLWMGIALLSITLMQLFGTPAKDITLLMSGLAGICTLSVAAGSMLLWRRAVFTSEDFQSLADAWGCSTVERDSEMEIRLRKGRILYQPNNFWRFDVFWLKPKGRPSRKKLLKKMESRSQRIHLDDFFRLIRAASPLVIVVDLSNAKVADTNRLCSELNARNPSTKIDLWAEHIVNGSRFITYITDLVEGDHLSIRRLFILVYLPQWERLSVEASIREAYKWLSQ